MTYAAIHLWGDSVGKGVVFDEERGRYAILRNRCAVTLQEGLGIPVVNHARMGATVTEGLDDFLAEAAEPGTIAVIEYGGNDCDMPWADVADNPDGVYEGRTPLPLFVHTLTRFVAEVRARGMTPLLVTPPPLDAYRYFAWVSRQLDKCAIVRFLGDIAHIYRWQERYSIAVRRVAEATRCTLFDLRDAFLGEPRYAQMLCVDGIHPNETGHEAITRAVLAQREALAEAVRA